jgi:flotillin
MQAVYENKITTAVAQRDYLLKKASYDQETFTKKAQSDLAYELQSAKTQQRIKEETMEIKVRVTGPPNIR